MMPKKPSRKKQSEAAGKERLALGFATPWTRNREATALFFRLYVTDADVLNAVTASGLASLTERDFRALVGGLNDAFFSFVFSSVYEAVRPNSSPSSTFGELNQISAALDKLVSLLALTTAPWDPKQKGRIREIVRPDLIKQADLYAKTIGGFEEFPPDVYAGGLLVKYHGDKKLGQLIDVLLLWQTIIAECREQTRTVILPTENRARRKTNVTLDLLLDSVEGCWTAAFKRRPTFGWDSSRGKPKSAYLGFTTSLLASVRQGMPRAILRLAPQIGRDLALSPEALRARGQRKMRRPSRKNNVV